MSRLKNFLNEIKKEYKDARNVYKYNKKGQKVKVKKVHRGRSRIIAGVTEDIFAKYLCKELKSIHIFVDQPISLIEKGKTYYPDIIICKKCSNKSEEYEILYMIDLKMDIGWFRSKYRQHARKIKSTCGEMIKHNKFRAKKGDVENEEKQEIKFSIYKKASYDMVIVSSKNSGRLEDKLKKDSHDKNSNIWVLSDGGLNQYKEKRETAHYENDYNALISKMRKVINSYKM